MINQHPRDFDVMETWKPTYFENMSFMNFILQQIEHRISARLRSGDLNTKDAN
jgi:hypothetical protein